MERERGRGGKVRQRRRLPLPEGERGERVRGDGGVESSRGSTPESELELLGDLNLV